MEIREIDPEDPVFSSLRSEKVIMGGKFSLPGFMQKREATTYQPQPKSTVRVPAEYLAKEIEREVTRIKSQDTLPQVRVKVPPLPPQIDPVVIQPKKRTHTQIPQPKPIEPLYFDPDPIEEPMYIQPPVAPPRRVAQMQPSEYQNTDDIYKPVKRTGFSLPHLPSFRKQKKPDDYLFEDNQTPARFGWKAVTKLIIQVSIAVALVYFGLTFTGSYYTPASRFAGQLAVVFYEYQFGTFMAIVGCIIGYAAFLKAWKL